MKRERLITIVLGILALTAVAGLGLITVFIFREGLPVMLRTGVLNFLFGRTWEPDSVPPKYGILPFIVGSLSVTAGAMVIGVIFGVGMAILLTQFSSRWMVAIFKPMVQVLAGIPSVVYGFMGMIVLAPYIKEHFGGQGLSILAASVVLGIMVLPTVISISVDALQAVPPAYREGSIALGATEWQTTRMVMMRAARSGVMTAIILGMGRAIGETMAVLLVVGNVKTMPGSLLDQARTLTSHIVMEMPYAGGEHRQALFATGVVLFVIIMALNVATLGFSQRRAVRNRAA